jgi:glycyl-tRNA synthetase
MFRRVASLSAQDAVVKHFVLQLPKIDHLLRCEHTIDFPVDQLTTSSVFGRRYRRQDEAGTPYCFTIDGQTLQDDTVTIRDRDTT